MAVAKLGAIVTGLAGSVGGTTFRRGRAVLVVQNKSRGRSRSATLTNSALNRFSVSIAAWSTLPTGTKALWGVAASTYQFPDKFGTLKYLTPRQLFLKLNADRFWLNLPLLDPSTLSSTPAGVIVDTATLTIAAVDQLTLNITGSATDTWRLHVQFQKVPNFIAEPVFNARKGFYNPSPGYVASGLFDYSFVLGTETLGYPVQVGDKFNVYMAFINESGFRSAPQVTQIVVA